MQFVQLLIRKIFNDSDYIIWLTIKIYNAKFTNEQLICLPRY